MNAEELKNLQTPLKDQYRRQPEAALITLKAQGRIGDGLTCKVETGQALVKAGLHPATGGTGLLAVQATCCWRRWPPAPASP
jgi:hypothetical protein